MSITSEIERIKTNIANAYTVCGEKGATMPDVLNSANLSDTINSIEGGQKYFIYGVFIDTTNSNPETSVTYTDDAVGMTAGSNEWDNTPIFKNIKPCMLKDGVVQYYLNPNDFTKKEDGTNADITSGNDGDVMIEIPKLYYEINTNGSILTVRVTDAPNIVGFNCYAHTRDVEGDREKLYIGAYLAYYDNSSLRSLSGKSPIANVDLSTLRNRVHAKGTGYDMLSFYPLTLIQCLYLIKYKNLNSQEALGKGYTNSSNTTVLNTGGTDTKGMCYGETNGTEQMKLFGMEDLWGNLYQIVEGIKTIAESSRNTAFHTSFNNFSTSGSYQRVSSMSSNEDGFKRRVVGTNKGGFIPSSVSGASATTYWCDRSTSWTGNTFGVVGGRASVGDKAGIFFLDTAGSSGVSYTVYSARLMYL